jgi:hypothetical protein
MRHNMRHLAAIGKTRAKARDFGLHRAANQYRSGFPFDFA